MNEVFESVGILGGTFDPVHYGHLIIAEAVREGFNLDKILFIPSGQPPHKDNSKVSSAVHRFSMLKAAIETNPCFDVSRIEVEREGYTYTVDTLTQLRDKFGRSVKLYFIIGADIVPELITWKEFKKVFDLCEFIAVLRPGNDITEFNTEIDRLKSEYMARIHTIEVPLIDISSTEIRKKVCGKKSIKYLVPDSVETYIKNHGIYWGDDSQQG